MENKHKIALYVSYYLSRFNDEALANLDYATWNKAFEDIGRRLSVKPHSVKNWRDEFDPIFGHRAGWYQRPMSPSRVKVAQALEYLNEQQIRGIVLDILTGKLQNEPDEEAQLLSIVSENTREKATRKFILRAPTGIAAEVFFIEHFDKMDLPKECQLVDCRDLGCGYDFKLLSINTEYYIEVKGLADVSGGILFTDKEWRTAIEKAENYYLVIVKNVKGAPKVSILQNPASIISPRKNILTSIQINWSVSENELNQYNA